MKCFDKLSVKELKQLTVVLDLNKEMIKFSSLWKIVP